METQQFCMDSMETEGGEAVSHIHWAMNVLCYTLCYACFLSLGGGNTEQPIEVNQFLGALCSIRLHCCQQKRTEKPMTVQLWRSLYHCGNSGNTMADLEAKAAAVSADSPVLQMISVPIMNLFSPADISDLQSSNKPTLMGCNDDIVSYCTALNNVLKAIFPTVKAALPQPLVGILHKLQPGDWVVVKDLRRKHWNQQRWTGPFQVLLTTPTAVRVAERSMWIHANQCRRVPHH
ncbi:hypothetical protein J4Q44_G00238170 [Coregonus suidteri]|uniref:Murine leukemia virus integrase C-terminal domain-containing protein n=1 Tax=Coregonus suidteri TaxID=861788 RepID=A0AAN8LB99_9TELE